jgi:hypothetical protein
MWRHHMEHFTIYQGMIFILFAGKKIELANVY